MSIRKNLCVLGAARAQNTRLIRWNQGQVGYVNYEAPHSLQFTLYPRSDLHSRRFG